jgi:hypothetical protein
MNAQDRTLRTFPVCDFGSVDVFADYKIPLDQACRAAQAEIDRGRELPAKHRNLVLTAKPSSFDSDDGRTDRQFVPLREFLHRGTTLKISI